MINIYTKSCFTSDECWIVILELTVDSVTNQARLSENDPNRKFAKFRANKLKVIDIINKFDHTQTINYIYNSVYDEKPKLQYVKETIVNSDSFDMKLDKICSHGIHFFEGIEVTFYYGLNMQNYTGHWVSWYNDGQNKTKGYYLNGKRTGHWIYWHSHGNISKEGDFIDGKKTGHWIYWYDS
jgi:antitoxin component YwqK of YwqJK toxin-antitoxin module